MHLRDELAAGLRERGCPTEGVNRRVVWSLTWEALEDESSDVLQEASKKSAGSVKEFQPRRNERLRSPEVIEGDVTRAAMNDADVNRRLADYRARYETEKADLPPTAR